MRPVYPPLTPGLPRVTQSSIETTLRCGERYRREQEEGYRRCTVPMAIGTGVHAGAGADDRAKGECQPLSLPDLVEISVQGYKSEIDGSLVDGSKLEIGQGVDETASAARAYAKTLSPQVEMPVMVEVPMVARVEDLLPWELAGTPDLYDDKGFLHDRKVGRQWSPEAVHKSRQLSAYGILIKAHTGAPPAAVAIDNVYEAEGRWRARRILSTRTETDYAAFLEIARSVVRQIRAGNFLPAPEGAWWCSRRWCPFYRDCRFVNPGGANG